MTELTRRRRNERFEAWEISCRDVIVGSLSHQNSVGCSMIWQWACGFYPGCELNQMRTGREDTFEGAKAAFQRAWDHLMPQITEDMKDEWRRHQAFTAWKYAMWDAGCWMPTRNANGRSRCFCGAEIAIMDTYHHIYAVHMELPDVRTRSPR